MSQTLSPLPLKSHGHDSARVGFVCGFGAYLWWGFVAVYLKLVSHVPPMEVLAHRIVWSLLLVMVITAWRGGWTDLKAAARDRRTVTILLASTAVLSINWFIFIFAVTTGRVTEASLGYFINPLVNVLLGMIFLHERLRPWQAIGLALACAGVAFLAWSRGHFPWIAVGLAITFGHYGLFRKIAPVGSIPGLTIETAILFIPALLTIALYRSTASAPHTAGTWLLLMLAGVVTAIPLLLFAAAARRLRLMTMGFLQYLAPTVQFLLAIVAFKEPFGRSDLLSFGMIWLALVIYSLDTFAAYRQGLAVPVQAVEEP